MDDRPEYVSALIATVVTALSAVRQEQSRQIRRIHPYGRTMLFRMIISLLTLAATAGVAQGITGAAEPVSDPVTLNAVGSLVDSNGHVCSATRISPGWLITADHCLDDAPVAFVTRNGQRLVTSGAVRKPKHDLALLGIADDPPGGAYIPLLRPGTPCNWGGPVLAHASRIITIRHRDDGGLPATLAPVTAVFAGTFRDCSVYQSETTYLTSSHTDPPAFAVCSGDSGSPVVHDGPGGMALRGVMSAALIEGDGLCSNQRPTGVLALADAHPGWIDAHTATSPPRTALRIRRAELFGRGRVALRGVRAGALAHGAATITWIRSGRPVMRRSQLLTTEWRPLIVQGPRTPGRYRVRIEWNGGVRTSNAFWLRRPAR